MKFFQPESHPVSFSQCWSFPIAPSFDLTASSASKALGETLADDGGTPATVARDRDLPVLGEATARLEAR
jgi:hypothetical protein